MIAVVAITIALAVSLVAPLVLKPLLHQLGVVDVPNARSSHTVAVLRGLGLGPLVAVLSGLSVLAIAPSFSSDIFIILTIAIVSAGCGLLGWVEDSRGLPITVRAAGQMLLGVAGAGALAVSTGMSFWMVPLLAIAIASYVNVANFMDGINGISGLHGAAAGVAFAAIGTVAGELWMIPVGLVIAAAFAGFLPWNLGRGGMFLGDVGSYLLGGSLAMVAAAAIARGVPVLGAVAPLTIYFADSGVTLARRVLRGERWYEPHRTHTYQRLTDAGASHVQVATFVTAFGVAASAAGLFLVSRPDLWALSAVLLIVVAACYFALGKVISNRTTRRDELASGSFTA